MARLLQNLVDPPSPVAWMPLTVPLSCVLLHEMMLQKDIERQREREKKCPTDTRPWINFCSHRFVFVNRGGLVAMMRYRSQNLSERIGGGANYYSIYGPARLLARWGASSKVRQNG